jgi:hypothetical protein
MEHLFRRSGAFWAGWFVALIGLVSAGCSSPGDAARREGFSRVITPEPPGFLTGPTALLLTNWASFSARLEVLTASSTAGASSSSGQLLGQGSKLLYAPHTYENPDAPRPRAGGYSFIWDVAQSRGYVLSETLQGYAPVVAELQVTNLQIAPSAGPAQRYSGHNCEPANATVQTADSTVGFELLRATDLHGFPVKIQMLAKANPLTLSFSNVRFENVSAHVFAPPEGFTQYPSPQAMADELAARENNLRRRSSPRGPAVQELERRY